MLIASFSESSASQTPAPTLAPREVAKDCASALSLKAFFKSNLPGVPVKKFVLRTTEQRSACPVDQPKASFAIKNENSNLNFSHRSSQKSRRLRGPSAAQQKRLTQPVNCRHH